MDLLERGLAQMGLTDNPSLAGKLAVYIEAIEEWNPAYGLVGASGDELVIKHILDSLAPVSLIRAALDASQGPRTLVDVGTGAGLPGIPLALAMPDVGVTLLDRMTRRINFLRYVTEKLGRVDIDIVEEQVERSHGAFGVVTFRAFRPFERKLFRKVFGLCHTDGAVVAYKGKADRANAELTAIEGLYASATIVPLAIPFLPDERCAVVLKPASRQR